MAGRRLAPEERAVWQQLARSVRPLRAEQVALPAEFSADTPHVPGPPPAFVRKASLTRPPAALVQAPPPPTPSDVLDSRWEKHIRRGQLVPDMSIDLHGHSLSAAHQRLDRALVQALAQGVRVLLVVTGKARERTESGGRPGRGAIRAEISHWIDASPHADRIASVRAAHPRHGGEGAIYLILRRKK